METLHKFLSKKSHLYDNWHKHRFSNTIHEVAFFLVLGLASMNVVGLFAEVVTTPAMMPVTIQTSQIKGTGRNPMLATTDLLQKVKGYNTASFTQKQSKISEVISTALARKGTMLDAAKTNPQAFLLAALPGDAVKQMPSEVAQFVESKKSVEGKYEVMHIDYENQKQDTYAYEVTDTASGKVYNLHFAQGEPGIKPGSTVKASGVALDNELVLAAAGGTNITTTGIIAAASVSAGDQRTIVMLVNFTNATATPWTRAQTATSVFATSSTSVNTYYAENSGKITSFSGDVTAWITVPYTNVGCGTNYGAWAVAADTAATAQGYILSNYGKKLYVLANTVDCGWSGLSYVGGTPGRSWVLSPATWIEGHELGHALGMMHASSYTCGANAIDVATNCTQGEYNDPYDVMGYGALNHVNAAHKVELSWLTGSSVATISSGNANFTIYPLETPTSNTQVVKVARPGTTGYYYIEYRTATGYDAGLPATILGGVGIHYWAGSVVNTQLLDTTPGDGSLSNSFLSDGKSFYDQINNITITQVSHSATSAVINVAYGPLTCTKSQPTLSVSPLSQTGSAGKTLNYSLSIKNNDSAGCTTSSFAISGVSLPAGFTASTASVSIAPGATVSAVSGVTSPAGVLDGSYPITLLVADTADATHKVQGQVTYVSITDTVAPTVVINTPANGSTIGNSTNVSVAATDNLSLARIDVLIDGVVTRSSTVSPFSFKWSTRKVTAGTHTIAAIAYDTAGNSSKTSITVTK